MWPEGGALLVGAAGEHPGLHAGNGPQHQVCHGAAGGQDDGAPRQPAPHLVQPRQMRQAAYLLFKYTA